MDSGAISAMLLRSLSLVLGMPQGRPGDIGSGFAEEAATAGGDRDCPGGAEDFRVSTRAPPLRQRAEESYHDERVSRGVLSSSRHSGGVDEEHSAVCASGDRAWSRCASTFGV